MENRIAWLTCWVDMYETVAVVRVQGEIDAFTSADLGSCFGTALAGGPSQVVIDLGEVTFIAGSGLRLLERFRQECQDRGLAFGLARPAPHVQRLLERVDMDRVLPVLDLPRPGP